MTRPSRARPRLALRPSPPAAGSRTRGGVLVVVLIVLAILAAVLVLWIRSQRSGSGGGAVPIEQEEADRLARQRMAAWYSIHVTQDQPGSLDEAEKLLAPLLARREPATEDLIASAILARARGGEKDAEVRRTLGRVLERDPDDARAHYILARMDILEGRFKEAELHLRRVQARVPDDLPTLLALGWVVEEQSASAAEVLYRTVLARGVDNAGSWYMAALFRLSGLLRDRGRDEEFEHCLEEFNALMDRGLQAPKDADLERGNLGNLIPPSPKPVDVPVTVEAPEVAGRETILPELAGFQHLLACDLDGNGTTDLVGWGARGITVALRSPGSGWSSVALETSPVDFLLAADLTPVAEKDKDQAPSALDLIAARGGALHWWRVALDPAGAPSWKLEPKPIFELESPPRDGLVLDYDHEGDLDLAFAGAFGLRVLRNDGARSEAPGGGFTDVSQACGAPLGRAFEWVASEDFDTDQDVDLLVGSASDVALLSNLRGGKFESVGQDRLNRFAVTPIRPICADLDHDARPDLWGAGPFSLVYFNQASLVFRPDQERGLARGPGSRLPPSPAGEPWAGALPTELLQADIDLDGLTDAAWRMADVEHEDVLSVQLAIGRLGQAAFDVVLSEAKTGNEPCLADIDGDLAPEALISGPAGVLVTRFAAPRQSVLHLSLRGVKDNRRGVGAIVEAAAGGRTVRRYWRGEATDLGFGPAKSVDWLRVVWPNGVIQYDVDPAFGDRTLVQILGLVGSCPFLYTWNGERYEFVSDVLGITPLGLPMAPGRLVPPDHDEYVLVRGEQLAPKHGHYELQLTEELREVTYLDRLRLDVVDHPEGTQVFPNERFCFPPFPLPHVHTVEQALSPLRAVASDGRDVTEALAREDDEFAGPLDLAPAQLLGLCAPHFVELDFDPERVRAAKKLRLFLTGWLYWTDASVNLASARDPGFEFIPPILQVPDGKGGWRDAGPPIGFPAGKTKTMVVDVTEMLVRDDPRLRIFTSLRLHWDCARLATCDDNAPLRVTELEPRSAKLWRRGFSAPLDDPRPAQPARFDWDHLAERPVWNPHPGLYTKYGEVVELVLAIDDQFAILGSGDALHAVFDAAEAPPLPEGWRRDFFVFLDGWAKDRDPNTVQALHVAPLPFHGMSGYPYGPDERFPRTPETRAWMKKWQTRPAEPWIPLGR